MGNSKAFKEPKKWTALGFLDEFKRINDTMQDRSFAFLLGAGTSVTSGIPTGETLVLRWISEMHKRQVDDTDELPLKKWATAQNLGIKGFNPKNAAAFYPQIYDQRFSDDPESGYAYIEDVMSRVEPSYGYSILAKVLAETRHKVVITTNFDNLVSDALSIYTDTFPLVCGHESLTGFVRLRLRRALVAKIHRDLLFAPKSGSAGTSVLPMPWQQVLKRLFEEYTFIAIGYGGNDGSLMDFLYKLEPGKIVGGLFWCYREADGIPEKGIRNLVSKQSGKLIPILGFDEFMMQLGQKMEFKPLTKELKNKLNKRIDAYHTQQYKIARSLERPVKKEAEKEVGQIRKGFEADIKLEDSWVAWVLNARDKLDVAEGEKIFRKGLKKFPNHPEFIGNFAYFLAFRRKKDEEAERLFRRSLELDPNIPNALEGYGLFLWMKGKDPNYAESLFLRSLKRNPKDANTLCNYGGFLLTQNRLEEAKERVIQSWKLNSNKLGQLAAETAFYWCLITRMNGRSNTSGLARLKWLLIYGFKRTIWRFDPILDMVKEKLPLQEIEFYSVLADSVLNAERVEKLNKFIRWKNINPINVAVLWEL